MSDLAGELEQCFAHLFREGLVTPEDLRAVQIFPTPSFDRLRLLWRPIWAEPSSHFPEWGDLAVIPIRGLSEDVDLKEAELRKAPGKAGEVADDVRDKVDGFMEDLATAVRKLASHTMFSGKDCLTGFFIASPTPNDDERTRPGLVDFAGPRPALGVFPVRNLHDLGPGRKKARRYAWCQYHEDGLTLLLPEGERCTPGIVGRNPTRFFTAFESLTRFHLSESEIRFSTDAGETLLVPGHSDPNRDWDDDLKQIAELLEKQAKLRTRLEDRYQDLRRRVLPASLPVVVSAATPLRTEAWMSGRGPDTGEYEAVNCYAVPSPSTSVAAIRDGSLAHLVFQRQGIWTLDGRKDLPAGLERIPYERKEDDPQVPGYMRRLVTTRNMSRSIDPHPLSAATLPPPFVAHLDLPEADIFAAVRSTSFILLADRNKGLVSVDAADPLKLLMVGIVSPKGATSSDYYEFVAANERLAVIGSRIRFWFFDLADPGRPMEIDLRTVPDSNVRWTLSAGQEWTDALIHGSTLFLTAAGGGVFVFDVSDPLRPTLHSVHRLDESRFQATRMQFVENHLFVFDLAGGRCWVNRIGDSGSPLRSLGTFPFSAFARAWTSPTGAACFLSSTGEVWTLDLTPPEPALRSVERCLERWGTARQPIRHVIDAVPLPGGALLAMEDGQISVLRRQPLSREGRLPQESRLRLIGNWDPGLTPIAATAPASEIQTPDRPFLDTIAEKVGSTLRRLAHQRPGFRLGSLIVDIKDWNLNLLVNPGGSYLTAAYAADEAVEVSWSSGMLFSEPAEREAFQIVIQCPELSRPLIQAALGAIEKLPQVQELSSGRVRLGSRRWGITKVLFRDRRSESGEAPALERIHPLRKALDSWLRSGDRGYVPRVLRAYEKDPQLIEEISRLAAHWEYAQPVYRQIIATHPELQSPLLDKFFRLLGDYSTEFDALIAAQEKILARITQIGEDILKTSTLKATFEGSLFVKYAWDSYPRLYDFIRVLDRHASEIKDNVNELSQFFSTLKGIRDAIVKPAREILETRRIAPGRLGHLFYDQRKGMERNTADPRMLPSYPGEYWDLLVKFEELVKSLGPLLLDRISQGDTAAVRSLLEVHEVPTYFEDARGHSVVQVAVDSGVPEMVELLCRHDRPVPAGCLERAILDADEKAVGAIVGSGSMYSFVKESSVDCHALACALGRPEVSTFLKEPEPSPEVLAAGKERPKSTPARLRIARLLLSSPLNMRHETERTCLMVAAVFGTVDVVRELLRTMPQLDQRDKTGRTALDWAVKAENDDVISLLKGPD